MSCFFCLFIHPPVHFVRKFGKKTCYVHLGSANLDSRSLRLNFELTLEVLDQHLAIQLTRHFDTIMAKSRPVTRQELNGRSLPVRLRDAFFWLFSPYL